jgi:hypothetical protein
VLPSALALFIVVHKEQLAMVFHKHSSSGLIWLVFSLLVLLVACSSNNTILKPTPPAHLVSTLWN